MSNQVQVSKEELEKNIEELTTEYNTHVESLTNVEAKLNDVKDKSFSLLKQLYKQRKFSDPSTHGALANLEKEYDESESLISGQQSDHYQELIVCFRQLQKLRQLQHTYLVGIINGLQKELAAVKSGQNVEDVSHAVNAEVRQNNLA